MRSMKLSLVSYLDKPTSLVVRDLQRQLSGVTNSKASLTSWEPHITVGDGVEITSDDIQQFTEAIQKIAEQTKPFELNLRDIATMDNWGGGKEENVSPFVIYLRVEVNDALSDLVRNISQSLYRYDKWYNMPKPYTPHCTLAFRDLTEKGYRQGMEYLKDRNIALISNIDHIALVEKLPEIDREFLRFDFVEKI